MTICQYAGFLAMLRTSLCITCIAIGTSQTTQFFFVFRKYHVPLEYNYRDKKIRTRNVMDGRTKGAD